MHGHVVYSIKWCYTLHAIVNGTNHSTSSGRPSAALMDNIGLGTTDMTKASITCAVILWNFIVKADKLHLLLVANASTLRTRKCEWQNSTRISWTMLVGNLIFFLRFTRLIFSNSISFITYSTSVRLLYILLFEWILKTFIALFNVLITTILPVLQQFGYAYGY